VACLDLVGTLVVEEDSVLEAFSIASASQDGGVVGPYYAAAVHAGAVAPVAGATETLAVLRAAGIRICLTTGFPPPARDAVIDALGWHPLIDLALSASDVGRGVPWPDLPLTALLRLGGGAVGELAVAGDTAGDVESGLRAGAGVVAGVLTGAGSAAELEQAGAPHVLESITALIPLLRPAR